MGTLNAFGPVGSDVWAETKLQRAVATKAIGRVKRMLRSVKWIREADEGVLVRLVWAMNECRRATERWMRLLYGARRGERARKDCGRIEINENVIVSVSVCVCVCEYHSNNITRWGKGSV